MVSGFVTSPCDQLRIFSGEAKEIRIASKSVIGLVSSNGLERYKMTLLGTCLRIRVRSVACYVPGVLVCRASCPSRERLLVQDRALISKKICARDCYKLATRSEPGRKPGSVGCRYGRHGLLLVSLLDEFHIKA